MNFHRVSTHISPIASEVAAQRTVFFGHWKSRPARAPPKYWIELEAHSLPPSKIADCAVVKILVKILSQKQQLAGSFVEPGQPNPRLSMRNRKGVAAQQMRQ